MNLLQRPDNRMNLQMHVARNPWLEQLLTELGIPSPGNNVPVTSVKKTPGTNILSGR